MAHGGVVTNCDVEIEDDATWPAELRDATEQNRDLLLDYHRERQRIDELMRDDVVLRTNPPINKFRAAYASLVDRVDANLTRNRLVAYHCTKLTPREIAQVTSAGLRVLSPDLVQVRLDECAADGLMTREEKDRLHRSEMLGANLSNRNGNRTGMIWFCPNRSTLRDSFAVFRLFRSWGGEAVYAGHEADAETSAMLTRIGEPVIVRCAIPFPCEAPYQPKYAERFFSQSISNEIEYPEPSAKFDLRAVQDVAASQILEVVSPSMPQFEVLTGYSNWPAHHRSSS